MLIVVSTVPQWLVRIQDWLKQLAEYFVALGPAGILLLAFVDSFLPLVGGPDVAVLLLCARDPASAPLVVVAATVGAAAGATVVYWGARKAGVAALSKVAAKRRDRVENLLGRFDILTIIAAALMPPPFPFKAFNLGAGVFKVALPRWLVAIFVGRGLRFSIEAFLAVRYGEQAKQVIERYGLAVLGVVAALALGFWLLRSVAARRADEANDPPVASE